MKSSDINKRHRIYDPDEKDIIFVNDMRAINWKAYSNYCIHLLCYEGGGEIQLGTKRHSFQTHDAIIITSSVLVNDFTVSDNFKGEAVCITESFLQKYSPENNYGIIGNFALVQNPVIHLNNEEWTICVEDFNNIRKRTSSGHSFKEEITGCYVRAMVLDFFDFHKRNNPEFAVTGNSYRLLQRFLNMLQEGAYIEHKDIEYYAEKLCITSKYLSEICRKASGLPASYWIDRFTISDIALRLRNKNVTLSTIAYDLNFSSISYFSRFVQRMLGVSPSQYRRNFSF